MRKYIIVALVLVVVGIGASLFLLPSPSETEHAKARDQQTIDIGNVDVEAEYNQGRRSFPIVAALADKRVAEGNRPAAIALLEEYTKVNPNDGLGHQKLAEQYMLAARQQDYNNEIIVLGKLAPTEDNLKVLSYIYAEDKNYPKQAETIQRIIDLTKGEKPVYYTDLANVKLVIGDKDGAMATLDELKKRHPDYSDFSVTRIRVSVLLEKGAVDQAFAEAKQWTDASHRDTTPADAVPPSADPKAKVGAVSTPASREAREMADLVNIFDYSGHPDKALDLAAPHLSMVEDSTEFAVAYVNASINANKSDDAYKLLAKLDGEGKITPDLAVPYMQLALLRNDAPAAKHIAETVKINDFSEEQALNMLEMMRAANATEPLSILLARINISDAIKFKPVLGAVAGILANTADQDKRISTALSYSLTSVQRLRLAESCARAAKKNCFDAIVAQYPPIDKMTTPQISEYAQLFIIANRPEEILRPVGLQAVKPQAHPEVIWAYVKLAAASGNAVIIKPWIASNAQNLPLAKLQELFFIANGHHHGAISSDIAERLYARDPSPMNRDLLIAGYNENNQPDKALPLLREAMKTPGADDAQYLATLNKMASKDAGARKEMVDYAQAALQANHGDDKARLNYVFILLNNGRRDVALPYVKAYAQERGGEWKKLYEQMTVRPTASVGGRAKKLSREEMLAMANNPNISVTTKRQIAFSLLNDGDKPDAVKLFQQMAVGKPADSQEVKELLYLWGGKLNDEQLAWVRDQAAHASPYDRLKWADVMNNYGDDRSVLAYVSATPDALYNANLRKKYFRVLAERGSKQDYDDAMRGWVSQTTDVPALLDYAATAQAYNYRDAAQNAYSRVTQLDANNAKALSSLATLNYAKGSYSKASAYTDRALIAEQQHPSADVDPSVTHFYKAQLLKTQGNTAGAAAEYNTVIEETQRSGTHSADALSRMYTAEFNVGRGDEAIAGFRDLLARNPENKNLLADYMGLLIEHKYYDEATRVANQFDKSSPYYGHQSALSGHSANVASVERFSNGREMRIAFSQPLEKSPLDEKKLQQLDWVEHTEMGYDSVTITAKPGVIVRYEPTAQDAFVVVPQPVNTQAAIAAENQRQEDLRLQLLYAQIEMNTNQQAKAQQRLAILDQYYPNDPQLLSFEGSVASSQGNNEQAVQKLQLAQNYAPENEGIAHELYDVTHAPEPYAYTPARQQYVMYDHEYRKYGSPRENIDTVSGQVNVPGNNTLHVSIANDDINPKGLYSPADGRPSNDLYYKHPGSGDRQYADLSLSHFFDNASRLMGTLFVGGQLSDTTNHNSLGEEDKITNSGTLGVGLSYAFDDVLGRSEVFGEYNRPYWDYAWASYYNAKRDRVGFRQTTQLNSANTLGIEAALNNYSIDPIENEVGADSRPTDDLAQTGLFRLTLTHQLQSLTDNRPYFGVNYTMDGEYALHSPKTELTTYTPNNGGPSSSLAYHPFDFYQHEAHVLQGLYRDNWTPATHVAANAGWVYDRINEDSGPIVGASLDQDLTKDVTLGVRGQYSRVVDQGSGNGDGVDLGANIKYKF